uniref:Uncharacterized protein n=1 Tax=Clytia hemisphaerica TaxID=252671 RepID=A0A7M5XB02_9CNID
ATSKTLIDLAITANPDKITKSGTYAPGISDHDLIYIVIGLRWKRKPPKIIFFKNYRNVDIIKLKEDLDTCPWDIMSLFDDVDDRLWCWEHLFKGIIADHVPSRKVKVRTENQPWMNGEVRKQLNQRFNLLNIARTTPKHSKEWKEYRKARNRCTSLIRSEKAKYWENEFIQSDSSKSFWSLVKKFKGKS